MLRNKMFGPRTSTVFVGRSQTLPAASRMTSSSIPTMCRGLPYAAGWASLGRRALDSPHVGRHVVRVRSAAPVVNTGPESEEPPQFNLPLGVELAAAAFEAYLQPVGAEGFQERSMSGAQITYTNEEFLSELYQGVLRVELKSALGLRASDLLGTSDPYVVLSLGGSTAKSKPKYWTVNPKWDQTFLLYVRDIEQDVLSLRVYDEDFLKADDDLGAAAVRLADMADGKEAFVDAKLMGPQATGSVQMMCTFLSFAKAPLADSMVAGGVVMPEKAPEKPDEEEQEQRVDEAVKTYLQNVERQRSGKEPVAAPDNAKGFFGMPDIEAIKQMVLRQVEPIISGQASRHAGSSTSSTPPPSSPPSAGPSSSSASSSSPASSRSSGAASPSYQSHPAFPPPAPLPPASSTASAAAAALAARATGNGLVPHGNGLVAPTPDKDTGGGGWIPKMDLVEMLKKQVMNSLREERASMSMDGSGSSLDSGSSLGSSSGTSGRSGDGVSNSSISSVSSTETINEAVEEVASSAWRVLAAASGRQTHGDTVPVAFVENNDTDTQVWLYRDVKKREAIIAFRGTEQVKWKDIVTDLNMGTARFDVERTDHNQLLPFTMRVLKTIIPTDEILVHQGFLSAYDSVKREVARLLDAITGTGEGPRWKVFVTGHSLGGALATICAFELSTRVHPARMRQEVAMYTYGAPRVGNKAFATLFNEVVRDSWRVTNYKDIIPSVPRLMGYNHVRHSVQLTPNGLLVQSDSRDPFGEGKSQLEVVQELYSRVVEQRCSWEDLYEEIVDVEMQVLNTLINGSALEQHMESYYLQTLQDAVLAAGLTEAAKLQRSESSADKKA